MDIINGILRRINARDQVDITHIRLYEDGSWSIFNTARSPDCLYTGDDMDDLTNLLQELRGN